MPSLGSSSRLRPLAATFSAAVMAGAVSLGLIDRWFAVAATALVLLAGWLRPWRLLAVGTGRLLAWRSTPRARSSQRDAQPVRRRPFSLLTVRTARRAARRARNDDEPTLTGPIAYRLPLRDLLFRAHGWLAGAALGVWMALHVGDVLRWPLFATRFEALADVLASCAGLLAGVGAAWALDRFPAWAAAGRLKGYIDGRAADAMLEFGASALACLFALALGGLLFQLGWWATGEPSVLRLPLPGVDVFHLPLLSLAALAGYALPWLVRRRVTVAQPAFWIVVAGQPSMRSGFMAPCLRLIDALASRWRDGPVTVLLDAAIEARGEHALAAKRGGQPRQLYPALAVEVADWAQALPPAERWTSLPVRELHPASALMVPALKRFIQPGDVVVLIARSAGALAPWRDALRHTRCVVAWLGPQTATLNSIAGFAAIPVRAAGLLGNAAQAYARIHEALTVTVVASPVPAVPPVSPVKATLMTPDAEAVADSTTLAAATNEPPPPAPQSSPVQAAGGETGDTATTEPMATPTVELAGTVFISYSHAYRELMQALVRALESIGVEVQHDGLLTAGQKWGVALAAMLESSDAVVALIGPPTASSTHQLAEIERAIQLGKLFIPVFVDHFKEPQAALAFMAANLDRNGRIRFLADCTPYETSAMLSTSAQRIVAALAARRADTASSSVAENAESAAPVVPVSGTAESPLAGDPVRVVEPSRISEGAVLAPVLASAPALAPTPTPTPTPDTLLTLAITMRPPDRLDFATLDTSARTEWSLVYEPRLVESLAASLRRGPWNVDIARTLSSLLLPTELRTLVSQAVGIRLHLVIDQHTAGFPWEVAFGLASGSVVPVSVVRRPRSKTFPPVRRLGAAAALLISNPSTRGAQTARGLPGELPPLPGTEMECRAVETILRRIGFTVAHSTGESATEVIDALLRTDHRIVLIAAHALHEVSLRDGTTVTGVPLSDGAFLGAREFEQMRQPPELVFIDATRLTRMDSIAPRDDAALQPQPQSQSPPQSQSLPAQLLQMGVGTVIAADSGLGDSAATDFCTAFFASVAEPERTVEQAMLAARRQAHARYPETGAWATYQLHGAAEYRIDAPEF